MKTPPQKLTNRDLAKLYFSLRDLNGSIKAVFEQKINQSVSIREPYGFSAQVTMSLAQNLGELRRCLDEYNTAISLIPKDATDRDQRVTQLLDIEVPIKLTVIPYGSLRIGEGLGQNRIPPGLVLDLMDVIDPDV